MTDITILDLPSPIGADADLRARIVEAADRLVNGSGANTLTLAQIADAAGVDRSALREEFVSKQGVVVAVLQHRHRLWVDGLRAATADLDDPRDELLGVFGFLESCFEEDGWRGCAFVNGYGELGRSDPVVAALADEHFTHVETHIATLCAAAGYPQHLADGITLLLAGAKVEASIHRTTRPARSARLAAAMLIALFEQRLDP